MPAKRQPNVQTQTSVNTTFYINGVPSELPKETRVAVETRVINHLRILDDVTLTVARKLIRAAMKANVLTIQIGMEPCCKCRCPYENVKESGHHPLSPQYFYYGADIRKLEPMLINDQTILECTATLSYGDGGVSVENNDDAENALDIIAQNHREPELTLYF